MTVYIWGSSPRGPHAPISHGTLMSFGDNPTDFDVMINDDLFRIRFEFVSEDKGVVRAEYIVEAGVPRDKVNPPTIRIRFFNVAGSYAFAEGPVRLATVGGMGIWIAYEVSAAIGSRTLKKIQYTIWDGSEG